MDPDFLAARQKHQQRKRQVNKESLTPFQIKLYKNPYALALATPVRECKVSKTRLPKFFLQGYNLVKQELQQHNEGGREEAWWMPLDLARRTKTELQGETLHPEASSNQSEITPKGRTVYTLSRKSYISNVMRKKTFANAFVESQHLTHVEARELNKASRIRPDADTLILELMRRRLVEELDRLIHLKRGYIFHWTEDVKKRQVAAYLWTGSGDGNDQGPGEFATMGVTGRKVPVYDLVSLLGEEKMAELKKGNMAGLWERKMVGVRGKNMTVELQMKLWKLQGYVAEYKELMDEV